MIKKLVFFILATQMPTRQWGSEKAFFKSSSILPDYLCERKVPGVDLVEVETHTHKLLHPNSLTGVQTTTLGYGLA